MNDKWQKWRFYLNVYQIVTIFNFIATSFLLHYYPILIKNMPHYFLNVFIILGNLLFNSYSVAKWRESFKKSNHKAHTHAWFVSNFSVFFGMFVLFLAENFDLNYFILLISLNYVFFYLFMPYLLIRKGLSCVS